MTSPDLRARVLRASEICRVHGITQAQVADAVGASQPQVSRILGGRGVRSSRLVESVLLYTEQFEDGVTAELVRANSELVEAVKAAWDGSAPHAKALATVIRSFAVLKSARGPLR